MTAGHKLGKDFIGGLIAVTFFLTRHPCRIVTTSVDGKQLEGVLWGEIRRFIQTSRLPLELERGGPLVCNHLHIRKCYDKRVDGRSYLIGRTVGERGEGLSGHHLERPADGSPSTLAMVDECSGARAGIIDKMSEWAHRMFMVGNPYECANEFKWAVKGRPNSEDRGGDIPREYGSGYHRRVFRIKAEHSPNVRLGLAEMAAGKQPSRRELVPGVLGIDEYLLHRKTWDPVKQCVGLDADFYEGAEVLMFPPLWLNRAEELHRNLRARNRIAKGCGTDAGEGKANSTWTAVDEDGIIEQISLKTPDTDEIVGISLAFMRKHNCPPDRFAFDRGGGGKQHADRMRKMGFPVRTVGFGEAVALEIKAGKNPVSLRREVREEKYAYKNRRAQMYGELREMLDPRNKGFAIPANCTELRRQLSVIPLKYDQEGRMLLPPKQSDDPNEVTLTKLIGHSPDEADSLVLAVHAMLHKAHRALAGAA